MVRSRHTQGGQTSATSATHPVTGHIATDVLNLFQHGRPDYKRVAEIVGLSKKDLSEICGVSKSSVRFDDAIPIAVAEQLRGMANLANLVAELLNGDVQRVVLWFELANPRLGNQSPRAMICGKHWQALFDFVLGAYASERATLRR